MKTGSTTTRMLFVLLMAVSGLLSAQGGPPVTTTLRGADIPMTDAAYVYYSMAMGPSSPAMKTMLRNQLSLDDDRYSALLNHMKATVDEINAYDSVLLRKTCEHRNEFKTVEQFAAAWIRWKKTRIYGSPNY